MQSSGPARRIAASWVLMTALVVVACSMGPAATSISGTPGASPPAPTVPGLDQLSLPPAEATAEPAAISSPVGSPPAGPPEGVPPPPPEVTLEYTGPADDLAGFVAAYRAAFEITDASDEAIGGAGARLCTYLQRQATPNGSVDLSRVVTEADINEPGYPREVWEHAFQIAMSHYCGGFSFAPGTEG